MTGKILSIICCYFLVFYTVEALEDYTGTEIKKCIDCLCHSVSGCWSRFNCARYSVSFDYWKTANSPVVNDGDDPDSEESYRKCMSNENCIVATIVKYTEGFGKVDCNCDGDFDCKDRLAIHLFGNNCENPDFTKTRATRFNECSARIGVKKMVAKEGREDCTVDPF